MPIQGTAFCWALLSCIFYCDIFAAVFGCRFFAISAHIIFSDHRWKNLWGGSCYLKDSLTASPQTVSISLGTFTKGSTFVIPSWRQIQLVAHKPATTTAAVYTNFYCKGNFTLDKSSKETQLFKCNADLYGKNLPTGQSSERNISH